MGLVGFIKNLPMKVNIGLKVAHLRLRNQWSNRSVLDPSGPTLSMTTYGIRYSTVHLSLEAISRGRLKPSRMILFLDDKSLFDHPSKGIQRLTKRGLEVMLVDNLGPHTKAYPYIEMTSSFHRPHVTGEDDCIYPRWWLQRMYETYLEAPSQMHVYRAHTMRMNDDGSALLPYVEWGTGIAHQPSILNFLTTVSGQIYPPAFLQAVKNRGRAFLEVCPKNDDLWFTNVAIEEGILISIIGDHSVHSLTVPGTQTQSLWHENIAQGKNDIQIKQTYSEATLKKLVEEERALGIRDTQKDGPR